MTVSVKGTKKIEINIAPEADIEAIAHEVMENHKQDDTTVAYHYRVRRQQELSIKVEAEDKHKKDDITSAVSTKKKSGFFNCLGGK